MLSLQLATVGRRSVHFITNKGFLSMSSSVNRLSDGPDKPSASGRIIQKNVNVGKGQCFGTEGGRRIETERPASTGSLMSDKVEFGKLSDEEKEIYFAHKEACEVRSLANSKAAN